MKFATAFLVGFIVSAKAFAIDPASTNISETVQMQQLYQRFLRTMREEAAKAPTNTDLSFMTNLDSPAGREMFQRMIVHPFFGYGWNEIPAPTMTGSNNLDEVEAFIATNGWNMYTNGSVFVPGINKPTLFRGLPWQVIHDRQFKALTDSGIFYVALGGFGPSSYGVAYNPKTNSFPRVVQGFKPLGQHWYAWAIPDAPVEGMEKEYEGGKP